MADIEVKVDETTVLRKTNIGWVRIVDDTPEMVNYEFALMIEAVFEAGKKEQARLEIDHSLKMVMYSKV